MRQIKIIASVSILALLVGSCSGDESGQQSATTPTPAPSAASTTTQATAPKSQPFSQPPLVAQQPTSVAKAPDKTPVVAGLVQSTNPDARVQQVSKGRKDPFAVIPTKPIVTVVPPEVNPASPVPELPSFPEIPSFDTATSGNVPGTNRIPAGVTITRRPNSIPGNTSSQARANRNPSSPAASKPPSRTTTANRPNNVRLPSPSRTTANRPNNVTLPSGNTVPTFTPELPKLPEPTLARSVEVTGVIQVGNVAQAIVKAPNETSSRYVSAGQRLSNGQVLVKRIEMGDATAPIVILEQYGVEVAKRVGEKVAPTQPGAPTAAMPAPSEGTNLSS